MTYPPQNQPAQSYAQMEVAHVTESFPWADCGGTADFASLPLSKPATPQLDVLSEIIPYGKSSDCNFYIVKSSGPNTTVYAQPVVDGVAYATQSGSNAGPLNLYWGDFDPSAAHHWQWYVWADASFAGTMEAYQRIGTRTGEANKLVWQKPLTHSVFLMFPSEGNGYLYVDDVVVSDATLWWSGSKTLSIKFTSNSRVGDLVYQEISARLTVVE